jgi:cation:H+ antiporter
MVSRLALDFDIPIMVAVAVVCLPMFFTGRGIARWEGLLLVVYYAAYTSVLILQSLGHDWLKPVTFSVAWFALPMTFLVLTLSFVREWRVSKQLPAAIATPTSANG